MVSSSITGLPPLLFEEVPEEKPFLLRFSAVLLFSL